jgi:two-component system, NtrC family, sensor kinase
MITDAGPMTRSKDSPRRSAIKVLQVTLAAAIVLPIILFGAASWLNYRAAFEAANQRIDQSLAILHEHVLRVFGAADLAMYAGSRELANLSDAEIRAREQELYQRFHAITDTLAQIHSLGAFARDGQALVASGVFSWNAGRKHIRLVRART